MITAAFNDVGVETHGHVAAMGHGLAEQNYLRGTNDFSEGVQLMAERRRANFVGR